MPQIDRPTFHELELVIERCFEEAEKVKYIEKRIIAGRPNEEPEEKEVLAIVNSMELIKHISKTIIGELYEFEISRKLGPFFRMLRSLESDCKYIEGKHAQEYSDLGRRIGEL